MKTLKFSNGDTMHTIGLGTWKATGDELKKAIKDALYAGYRHIDTAATYGNEEYIGEALAEVFAEGKIFREDVFITSKLWNDSHAEGQVIPALEESLKKLKLDYLDLYLIHWPVAFRNGVDFPKKPDDYLTPDEAPIIETWKQMENAKNDGHAKHIGVSNFSEKKLKKLISEANIKPEMNQIELHPLLQQEDLLDYCNSENILVTAYSPLGSGDRSKSMKAEDEPNMMDIDVLKEIARDRSAIVPQVLIAWHNHRGCAAIPKSTTKEHIIANFTAADVSLTESDMKKIAKLDRNYRYISGKFFEEPSKGYENLYDE
ncbi:aldo/keto reductase, diketogulonate reductase [Aequorivita sublithincola DSM 14238]|uniref:Aldo/keto reductase, diketogulonate reductase n=1 Tax=Aequorivita sublithincola (strain DSM 14238 / LMG 21431 / ACAM 643 / 9-3) TaxID=746697 RepID=I3YYJ7_AEQSU|nr:aldo/keto reductase [Aequorivita sublithincola]AFL82065.1 aldo/keto reductase, diketogulonate reductase [Aequorivita sublithincola DSM 14238]